MDVFSPKVLFYLEHRRQIQEWAKIGSQASDELHRWLSSWAEVMEESKLDGERLFHSQTEGTSWPKLFWYRNAWRAGSGPATEEGRTQIHAGIGLEWIRKEPHGNQSVHAGIFVQRRTGADNNEPLQTKVEDLLDKASAHVGRRRKWWPYYEFLEPVSEVVERRMKSSDTPYDAEELDTVLEDYRDQQIQLVEDLWVRYADLIDEALDDVR